MMKVQQIRSSYIQRTNAKPQRTWFHNRVGLRSENQATVEDIDLGSTVSKSASEILFEKVKNLKLRRSWFYIPGSDEKKLEKSSKLPMDVLCFDLEDGVAKSQKLNARKLVVDALNAYKSVYKAKGIETYVRINQIGSGLELDDLRYILENSHPDGIVIPKVESADQITPLGKIFGEYENRHFVSRQIKWEMDNKKKQDKNKTVKLETPQQDRITKEKIEKGAQGIEYIPFRLFLGIESSKGVSNLKEILKSEPRIEGVLFGAEDYAGSIGATRTPSNKEVLYARGKVINESSAYDKFAIDMISIELKDDKEILKQSIESRLLGFIGKQAIHPMQILPIHAAFSPSLNDIKEAEQIVTSFIENEEKGKGVFRIGSKMIELPIAIQYAKVLQMAKLINEKEDM